MSSGSKNDEWDQKWHDKQRLNSPKTFCRCFSPIYFDLLSDESSSYFMYVSILGYFLLRQHGEQDFEFLILFIGGGSAILK